MSNDANVMQIRCLLEALVSEREGMIAENRWRDSRGLSLAYVDADFCRNAEAMRQLREHL